MNTDTFSHQRLESGEESLASGLATDPTLRFGNLFGKSNRILSEPGLILTYDGRGALYQVFNHFVSSDRPVVLLPAFHCPTVVDPAIAAGCSVRYFAVNEDLSINVDDLLNKIDRTVRAVLIVNYFGFPSDLSRINSHCRDEGVILIEDCAHSFLRANPIGLSGGRGDIAIFSFKKIVPSAVGGGIRINESALSFRARLRRPPLRDSLVNIKRLFEQSVDSMGTGILQRMYHRAEAWRVQRKRARAGTFSPEAPSTDDPLDVFEYPFVPRLAVSGMPWYARRIIEKAPLSSIVDERRANYSALLDSVPRRPGFAPVFEQLPDSVCPWAFPIVAESRSSIDRRLKEHGVPVFSFGETLHETLFSQAAGETALIEGATYLSKKLLVIAIRQGLSPQKFKDVSVTISRFLD